MKSYRNTGSEGLHEELRDLMGRFVERQVMGRGAPFGLLSRTPVDVSETPDSVIVRMECPGANPPDMDVNVDGDVLTIKGEKRDDRDAGKETPIREERWFGSFTRSIGLPCPVENDKAYADFRDGIITVTLPKVRSTKGSRIKVNVR